MATLKSSSFKEGFLEIPKIRAAKTDPIPTPAPTRPIVDNPAPINLAACKIIITRRFEKNNDGIEDAPAFLHQADCCLEMESNH